MEIIVKNYNTVEKIDFNYEEIKQELISKLDNYKGVKYTEESLTLAKEDRAELNKIAKALNSRRLELEREYMKPFNAFKDKVKELIDITNNTVIEIDKQVKEFEEMQKNKKMEIVNNTIQKLNVNNVPNELLFDNKYLLKGASEKSIIESIEQKLAKVNEDLQILQDMKPTDFEDIKKYYFRIGGNLGESIKELNRIKELALKIEKKYEQPIVEAKEEPIEEYNLTVFCTKSQFESIKQFLSNHNIKSL